MVRGCPKKDVHLGPEGHHTPPSHELPEVRAVSQHNQLNNIAKLDFVSTQDRLED
eukprot:CAMPEP_0178416222 /NCGR_PEP_ID=MMETSP0689_2-20121128/23953_1 /TAXON_ID=160604 /ORGANISM="Amphidinium massartii, Strain CS-259" /LENGTH=54 /DNA_ID=CAMNT_0020037561 /DNA_START=496 /DNA_END=660 /DNA_ORIENTATION=-